MRTTGGDEQRPRFATRRLTLVSAAQTLRHAFKLFLPSWNFFDDFEPPPTIEFRIRITRGRNEGAASAWGRLFPGQLGSGAGLGRVLWNPWGNLDLFEHAQFDRAAEELSEPSASDRPRALSAWLETSLTLIARRRIQHFVRAGLVSFIPSEPSIPGEISFQWRIPDPLKSDEFEGFYISRWRQLTEAEG